MFSIARVDGSPEYLELMETSHSEVLSTHYIKVQQHYRSQYLRHLPSWGCQ